MANPDSSLRMRAPHLGPVVRRPLILDAASELFARAGYRGATMTSIASLAGVSKAVLYDCFPGGKREILDEILHRTETGFRRAVIGALAGATPINDRIRLAVDAFFGLADDDPNGVRVLFGSAGTQERRIAARIERARDRAIGAFSSQLRLAGAQTDTTDVLIVMLAAAALDPRSRPAGTRDVVVRAVVQALLA